MIRDLVGILVVLSVALGLTACGSDGKSVGLDTSGQFEDSVVDYKAPPDVPNHVFELVDSWDTLEDIPDGTSVDVPDDADIPEQDLGDAEIPPDVAKDLGPDGCVPQCTNFDGTEKNCGPDGCGSICGYCGYGQQCVECEEGESCEFGSGDNVMILSPGDAACLETCIPQCAGKQCGFDGCYGSCPPGCDAGYVCGEDDKCYPDCDHDANCDGKSCGSDGCGGVCGICGMGLLCSDAGQCIPHPCGDVSPSTGKCDGNTLLECIDLELQETPCINLGPDFHCKWDAPSQTYACAEGCVPQCELDGGGLKECGSDGCGSLCGECPSGWACENYACQPVAGGGCGWITATGECMDNTLWFCTSGILYKEVCSDTSTNCMFDQSVMKYRCK